ncbi:MAG: Nif3-like dinuclear metal center hexameric protein [Thermodesulfobacteriota bacterium]
MVVTIEDVARALEELAPPGLAEPWDRCGLQVGDPRAPVHAVLVALDPSPQALSEALRRRAQLLVTHHPLLLEPPASLDLSTPLPRLLADFIRSDVGVYAAHTSLDRAPGGVNDALARCLGLGEVRCLGSGETLYKLVVTIPLGYEDPVRRALAAAGAGKIGKYEGCGFGCRGMGVFVPREGARPFLGEPGKEERADETRWEVVVRRSALPGALAAVRREHPYEEPAVDVYALEGTVSEGGLGRWGVLPAPRTLGEWARDVAQVLGAGSARLVGDPRAVVERVGVCGGSGTSLWPQAVAAGVQVLVTGDVKYHAALEARQAGLALLDVGHAPSERVAIDVVVAHLASWAGRSGVGLEVSAFREADPFLPVEISGGPRGARCEKTLL